MLRAIWLGLGEIIVGELQELFLVGRWVFYWMIIQAFIDLGLNKMGYPDMKTLYRRIWRYNIKKQKKPGRKKEGEINGRS